jgi:NADPH2:quinone reductase
MMRAAWYTTNGEARDVMIVGELPTPQPGAGEVLVRLATSGVNPSDVKSRRGRPLTEPIIPHSDGAGVIEAVGAGVPGARVGERVWIWNGQWNRPLGTAADYIALPSAQAVTLPDNIDFAVGACFGIPALTALQAVHLAGDLKGKQVLVTGASSAVGHYITQLVTLAGGHVIGTVGSAAKAAHAKAAGAQDIIFYKTESVTDRVKALTNGRGAPVIIDMDFSTTSQGFAEGLLAHHGTVVCYGSNNLEVTMNFRAFLFASISIKFFLVYDLTPDDRRLLQNQLNTLLATERLNHAIGPRFSLDQIVQAHEMVEAGQEIGNVIIDL